MKPKFEWVQDSDSQRGLATFKLGANHCVQIVLDSIIDGKAIYKLLQAAYDDGTLNGRALSLRKANERISGLLDDLITEIADREK